MSFTRYGATWKDGTSDLAIEFYAIKSRGHWTNRKGASCGNGLSFHLEKAKELLWPWLENHRWAELSRNEIAKSKVAVLMGPASSSKTNTAAWVNLLRYYASPNDTLVLVSSTDMRSLELRVWGEIKKLHQAARDGKFSAEIPGHLIESKACIATDDIEAGRVRDLRKGVIAVPTVLSGKFIGLGKWIGIKQKNVFLVADEAQFMGGTFLSAFSNLDKNENFAAVVLGNPQDVFDPLGKAAEPRDGWEAHLEPTKTDVWDTRFMNGRCVNLVGTDSPNFDFPDVPKPRYPFLISRSKIEATATFFGKESSEYYSQCVGVMKIAQLARRIITPQICRKFRALEDVVWSGSPRIRIAGLDAAYGGDRCVIRHADFGKDIDGNFVLSFSPYVIVPVKVSSDIPPEDQIAVFCKKYCEEHSIQPENFFYDSTGRGSLGTSFARIWSAQINPVEFGGKPTNRPVSLDMYIHDFKTGLRRLKLCHEHYSKFVSELWFSVRYAIEASQVRNLGEEVMDEGCMREYRRVNDNRIEIETKKEMKERVGRSPDLFDCFEAGTLVSTLRGDVPIESIEEGDMVLTPFGFYPVIKLHSQSVFEVSEATFSNGVKLVGKGSHRVFSKRSGWMRLDAITIANEMESIYDLPIWKLLNLLFTKDERTGFKQLADIIKTRTGAVSKRDFYIGLSGVNIMGIFLKAFVSIIKTAIGAITELPILNWWKQNSTPENIFQNDGKPKNTESNSWTLLKDDLSLLPNGIALMLDDYGIADTLLRFTKKENPSLTNACGAGVHSCQGQSLEQSFVPIAACKNSTGKNISTLVEIAKCAGRCFLDLIIRQRRIVPVSVRQLQLQESKRVYDLSVDGPHVFYANGVLVENCTTIVMEGARRRGFTIKKMTNESGEDESSGWFKERQQQMAKFRNRHALNHAA